MAKAATVARAVLFASVAVACSSGAASPAGMDSGSLDGAAGAAVSDGGGGGANGSAGGFDGPQSTAEAFVWAYVGPGTGDPGVCGFASDQQVVAIGTPLTPLPAVRSDGAVQGGGVVHVTCKVDPNNGAFDVQLFATLSSGTGGGSLVVSGRVAAAGGTGLQGGFTTGGLTFRDTNCTVSLAYLGTPVPVGGLPAPGRVWGHVDCPKAIVAGQNATLADGAVEPRTCDAHADFLFQNCQ